jgi:hypothetical protein
MVTAAYDCDFVSLWPDGVLQRQRRPELPPAAAVPILYPPIFSTKTNE